MASRRNGTSRRRVVSGFATLLTSSAFAGERGTADRSPAPHNPELVNPVTEYPRPPFPPQRQDWPGLASRMMPRPDHGESSYRGTGRLMGRKALITGGDSGIGRATAIAFAREGADIAINYLPVEESDAAEGVQLIRAAGSRGLPRRGDIRDETFCNGLVANAAREPGGVDILVNNAGRQRAAASITDISTEQFDPTFKT